MKVNHVLGRVLVGTILMAVAGLLLAPPAHAASIELRVSEAPDRTHSRQLSGTVLSGNAYIFWDGPQVRSVTFRVDPWRWGDKSAYRHSVDAKVPYDLGRTAADGTARPLNTRRLPPGRHLVIAIIRQLDGGTSVRAAWFVTRRAVLPGPTQRPTAKPIEPTPTSQPQVERTVEPAPTTEPEIEPSVTPTPKTEPSVESTPTVEPSQTPTPAPTATATATATAKASATPTASPGPMPTLKASPQTQPPTAKPTPTLTPTETVQPSPTPEPSATAAKPTPTVRPSPTPTASPLPQPTVRPSPTPTASPLPQPTKTSPSPQPQPTAGPVSPTPSGQTLVDATFDSERTGQVSPASFNREVGDTNDDAAAFDSMEYVADGRGGVAVRTRLAAGKYAGSADPGNGNVLMINLSKAHDRACMSYRVRFSKGFDFSLGGKLPGLLGVAPGTPSTTPAGGGSTAHGWSGRLMWLGPKAYSFAGEGGNDNMAVTYLYHPQQAGPWGDNVQWHKPFLPDRWHHVKQCHVLNRVGQADGVLQAWFDGAMVVNQSNVVYRTDPAVRITHLAWSIFRGGNTGDWAGRTDGHVDLDDVVITAN